MKELIYPVRTRPAAAGRSNHIFVSPVGTVDNDGATPLSATTFMGANSRVKPGWTVTVLPGTYAYPIRTTRSGTIKKPITWRADGMHAALIAVVPGDVVVWFNSASNIVIDGFDVSGGRIGIMNAGKNVTITRNHIHNVGYRCTSAGGAGAQSLLPAVFSHNLIEKIGIFDPPCDSYHGINTHADSVLDSNTIQNCSGEPIWP